MQRKNTDPLDMMRKQFKAIIKKSYKSVEAFCWETGLNKATLSNFLNAKKDFQISTLVKIANALNKKAHYSTRLGRSKK